MSDIVKDLQDHAVDYSRIADFTQFDYDLFYNYAKTLKNQGKISSDELTEIDQSLQELIV